MNLGVKKVNPHSKLPVYATPGAACFDLHADLGECDSAHSGTGSMVVGTGLMVEIPEGYVMLLFSRSGHAFSKNTRLANCVGVIDSDFRGEVMVKLTRDDGGSIDVEQGERIAQAMVLPVPNVNFVEASELSETTRGEGGLGSTGSA